MDAGRSFDESARDVELRKLQTQERERLIGRMLAAKRAGAPVRKGERHEKHHWECGTLGDRP